MKALPLPAPTELERARAHLQECQLYLWWERARAQPIEGVAHTEHEWRCEQRVLAALSWVWEEQEKARAENRAEFSRWLDGIIAERFA